MRQMSVETVRNIRRYQKAEFRVNQNPDVHLALDFDPDYESEIKVVKQSSVSTG